MRRRRRRLNTYTLTSSLGLQHLLPHTEGHALKPFAEELLDVAETVTAKLHQENAMFDHQAETVECTFDPLLASFSAGPARCVTAEDHGDDFESDGDGDDDANFKAFALAGRL